MMKIVFMGTPEFAVATLDILHKNRYNIVGVVTAPDKMGGRGMKQVIQSPVKAYAELNNLTLLQPVKLKDPEFLKALKLLNADLQIVVAFRMLPEVVWSMPPLGTINLHGSLLPKYRGAAPINWAIINGEKITGVTTFFISHEIDTGDILLSREVTISNEDNAGSLHDKMKEVGAQLVLETVQSLENQSIKSNPQSGEFTNAPKIFSQTCQIDWNKSTTDIYNFIRGLSPYPGAWTKFDGLQLKILKANIGNCETPGEAGTYKIEGKQSLVYFTSDGCIECSEIQLEGKRKMNIIDFLNGLK
jgi:methionyl-tRNA formyltransferase